MRTPRSRTSRENFDDFMMAPSSQELEPRQNPGRFSPVRRLIGKPERLKECRGGGTLDRKRMKAAQVL